MRSKPPIRVLITSGPTREPIDPVRYISNHSTGYMGARLAHEALRRGHKVTVISGPAQEMLPKGARVIAVERAQEMRRVLFREAKTADAVIMAAAVCDFRPTRIFERKLRRSSRLTIQLEPTPDIIGSLPVRRGQIRAGFAVETERVLDGAAHKLHAKRLDIVFAQAVDRAGAPFGRGLVKAWLLAKGEEPLSLGKVSKGRAARLLLDKVERLWYGQSVLHPVLQ